MWGRKGPPFALSEGGSYVLTPISAVKNFRLASRVEPCGFAAGALLRNAATDVKG